MALNDGQGALELGRIEEVAATGETSTDLATGEITVSGVILGVIGADLTGDGQDEIAMYASNIGKLDRSLVYRSGTPS